MNELENLKEELKDPTRYTHGYPVSDLSKVWKSYGASFYDTYIGVRGWKGDWTRAAKHWFLAQVCGLSAPTQSDDVSGQKVSMVVRWLQGRLARPPAGRHADLSEAEEQANQRSRIVEAHTLLFDQVEKGSEIWQEAEAIRAKRRAKQGLKGKARDEALPPEPVTRGKNKLFK